MSIPKHIREHLALGFGTSLQSLTRATTDPSDSQYIEWDNSGTDPMRGPHLLSVYEGTGGNTQKTITTQPSNVTGVIVAYASASSAAGAGTLTYVASGTTLSWAENGDTAGSAVNVGAGGWFTLASANGQTIRVIVVAAELPVGDASDADVTLSSAVSRNPVVGLCYNRYTTGVIKNELDPFSACWNIESNWHDGTRMTMEGYLEFAPYTGSTLGAVRRPFFSKFNKETGYVQRTDMTGGASSGTEPGIYFKVDDGTANGTVIGQFQDNRLDIFAPSDEDSYSYLHSYSGRQSVQLISAWGDNLATKPTVKFVASSAGGSSQHRTYTLTMSDDTAAKTGVVSFRADSDIIGADTVMFQVGRSTTINDALVHFSSENFATSLPTMRVVAKTGQTRAIVEFDGVANDGTTLNTRKVQLYPKGYWAVRETGGSTDRTPTAGSGAVTPVFTDKPGTSAASASVTWFPMLDTSGGLFWVPGFAN